MGDFEGRVALVTGGASGIGRATVAALREAGARVAVADVAAIEDGVADASFRTDVTDRAAWPGLVADIETALGGLDVVHLNAGVTCGVADVEAVTDDQYDRLMRVNVDHVFFGLRAAVPALRRRGGGRIVVTASLAGLTGFGVDPVYTLTKHAVVGLVRGCADRLAADGVIVTAVCPGIVDTPLIAADRPVLVEAGFPLLRPEDIATAVLRAATDGRPGDCWFVQPGRETEPYRFARIPGPRTPGREGVAPPF